MKIRKTAAAIGAAIALGGCAASAADPAPSRSTTALTASASAPATSAVTRTVTEEVTLTSSPSTSSRAPAPQRHTIKGTFYIVANRNTAYRSNCRGFSEDGQGDIAVGASVTVRAANGHIVGVGSLDSCRFTDISSPGQGRSLTFGWRVSNVPDSDFYTIEVAHRGEVPFSRTQLARSHWQAHLSL